MRVGFAVISRGPSLQALFYGCSPSSPDTPVTFASHAGGCAVMMGRLHYRDELRARLSGNGSGGGESSSDVALALSEYDHWGREGLMRLEGDFCLVIWDARRNVVVAARDPLGGYPLFWTKRGDQFALSTGVRTLLNLLPDCTLNLNYIAEYLMLPALAIQERASEECVYRGIHRVRAGSIVEAQLPIGEVKEHHYWNWLDHITEPASDRLEEIAEQFAERFRLAVRERIRGRTAAHLSGGMDSTSVALIARDWLRAGVGEPPLHTLSLVYEQLRTLVPETAYLENSLDGQGGIIAHRIPADDLLAYDSFADPPDCDEPYPALFDMAKDRVMIDTAAAARAETILTGLGGDDTLEVLPYHIADLLRAGRGWDAWRDAGRWAHALNVDPWRLFYRYGFANVMPVWLRGGGRALLHRGRVDWRHQGEGTIAPWILSGFARSQNLYQRGLRNLEWLYQSCRPTGLALALASIQGHVGDGPRWSLAAPRGILIAHPFTDPRLLSFGLGIRLRFRQEPGQQKPLLAHAMREVLPEKIRNRRGKGHFNEVYYRGLSRNLSNLESLIRQAPIDDLAIFDKESLVECLRQTAMGIDQSPAGSMRLDLSLSLIKWLSMRDQSQLAMEPSETIQIPAATDVSTMSAAPC